MKQYEYEYVPLRIGHWFLEDTSEKHREIIDTYAAKGYRYVGFFPTDITDYGKIREMDLIFEKET